MKHLTFFEQLALWAEVEPERIALVDPNRPDTTFGYLYSEVVKARTMFDKAGVKPRSRVGILINDPGNYAVASIAVASGAICVPIFIYTPPAEAGRLFRLLKLESLITDLNTNSPLIAATIEAGVKPVYITNDPKKPCGTFHVISEPISDSLTWGFNSLDDTSVILLTTGSTAQFKIVPIHERLIAILGTKTAELLRLTHNDRYLNCWPLNHGGGLIGGVCAPLYAGVSTVLTGMYQKSMLFHWLRETRTTYFSIVPALYKDLINGLDQETIDAELKGSSLRFILTGSAPITNQFGIKLEKAFGVPLIQAYGMTEAFGITLNPFDAPKVGSVGKTMGLEVGIFDDTNNICKPYKTGVIKVKGDSVIKGYLDNEQANQDAFENGWFNTGDAGWMDDEGYFFLAGRLKELINKGGEKISPEEVEKSLSDYPTIKEAAVFGIPHPVIGEEIAAAIVLNPDVEKIDFSELKTYLSKELSEFKIPAQFLVTKTLPKAENGKILRSEVFNLFYPQISKIRQKTNDYSTLTSLEQYVYSWFEKVLNKSGFSIDDEFASLGGTSLNVVELLTGITAEIGEVIHVVAFAKASSVSRFSKLLESEYSMAIQNIVQLNEIRVSQASGKSITKEEIIQFRQNLPKPDLKISRATKIPGLSPVFILCTTGSGSTLLRVILAGNSKIFAPPELRLMNYHTLDNWKEELSGDFTFYQQGLQRALMQAFGYSAAEAKDWIDQAVSGKMKTTKIYREIQKAIGNKVIVDKTPTYSLYPRLLNKIDLVFDNPKYIHLVRNPIDMKKAFVNSHMEQLWIYDHQFGAEQLGELVWFLSNKNIVSFLDTIPEDRKTTVNFENIVNAPESTIKDICEFINVPFEESMLSIYDDSVKRMTDEVVKGSKMLGDPRFFEHNEIDKNEALSGFLTDNSIGKPLRFLAVELGYSLMRSVNERFPAETSFEEILEAQKQLTSNWHGVRKNGESLIIGHNLKLDKSPLFWCTQGIGEFLKISQTIDRPVYGMRSGHLMTTKAETVKKLAHHYCNEIEDIYPSGPMALGGFCQGAFVAWEIAKEMISKGREVALVCIMEANISEPFDGNMSLIFGTNSPFNPFLPVEQSLEALTKTFGKYRVDLLYLKSSDTFTGYYGKNCADHNPLICKNPDVEWKQLYKNFTVDIVEGDHVNIFINANDLALTIKKRCDEAL